VTIDDSQNRRHPLLHRGKHMNLNGKPTTQQLRDLIAQCDDTGDVAITRVPDNPSAAEFQRDHPEMQVRCETFLAGNEYVGPEAAEDEEWISELCDRLIREWRKVKGKSEVATIGRF
jgi:hypothetical protein